MLTKNFLCILPPCPCLLRGDDPFLDILLNLVSAVFILLCGLFLLAYSIDRRAGMGVTQRYKVLAWVKLVGGMLLAVFLIVDFWFCSAAFASLSMILRRLSLLCLAALTFLNGRNEFLLYR